MMSLVNYAVYTNTNTKNSINLFMENMAFSWRNLFINKSYLVGVSVSRDLGHLKKRYLKYWTVWVNFCSM